MDSAPFFKQGWCRFTHDPILAHWVEQSLPAARRAVDAPDNQKWLRCGGTWYAGVNVLGNDVFGAVLDGPRLDGQATEFIRHSLPINDEFEWEPAQVSVCYPGYPQPMPSESESGYRYRCKRDAAHVDGLIPEGPTRRRHLREHHGFILGIPMVETSTDASPVVIWEGSHEIVRNEFSAFYQDALPSEWGDMDVTDAYQITRRLVFKTCKRIEIHAKPGEAYLIHRLSLHGVAPWGGNATATTDGRMICYFRPEIGGPKNWLKDP